MLNFVSDVVRQYDIRSNCVRAAVIRYSNSADAPIQLNFYSNVNQLVQAIARIQFLGGSSNLAAALDLLRSQVFASNIVRGNTAQIAIIVTDQLQSRSQIQNAANNVKSQGITVIAVGVTRPNRVDTNFLYSITSNRWAIPVGDYSQLVSSARNVIVQQYGCRVYEPPPPTTASPCMLTCLVYTDNDFFNFYVYYVASYFTYTMHYQFHQYCKLSRVIVLLTCIL